MGEKLFTSEIPIDRRKSLNYGVLMLWKVKWLLKRNEVSLHVLTEEAISGRVLVFEKQDACQYV